ncbi:HNH endonuclease family protein [Rhodococcus sp. MTM3W5.2]|nr:HNH endonuclease family protein [Rhodococcus sp. MTM3W5.2]
MLDEQPFCAVLGCQRASVEVDHIVPLAAGGDRYDRTNLRGICVPHHREKTAQEAAEGRKRRAGG